MPLLLAPPFLVGLVAAVLYARGRRRHLRIVSARHRGGLGWRALAFWAGLAIVVLALDSPIDDQAERLFWVHMGQHVLLMMVAAPLLVLAAPWIPMWKGLPLSSRRGLGAAYMRSRGWRGLRAVCHRVAAPIPVWILFNVDLCVWHAPALYGLTLRIQAVHDLEHISFLVLAVLFWAQVIESPPLRPRFGEARRVVYVMLGATVCWLLAVVLAFAPSPLYEGYGTLASRPGGLSALADQQLAAGIMWGPGSIPYAVFVFVALYRWLGRGAGESEVGRTHPRAPLPFDAMPTPWQQYGPRNPPAELPEKPNGSLLRRS